MYRCDRCTRLYAILFGDEQHLSSLHGVLTLQTALLVSALFVMVVIKCESCYLVTVGASAFFLCAILIVKPQLSRSRGFRPHGDEEKKKLLVVSVFLLQETWEKEVANESELHIPSDIPLFTRVPHSCH